MADIRPVGSDLELGSRQGRLALTATIAASSMASLDATIVNIALPQVAADLDADVAALQWVLTGYLLSLASLILLAGALGDRMGRRRIFLMGTAWFAGASLLCGLAPNVEVLIGARILQGVGGALLTPGSLAIIQATFRQADRAAAVGLWSGLGGVAGAVGPFLGGSLVDGPGWRWAFLLNLPVAALVVVCARVAVPETFGSGGTAPLDGRGAACAVAVLASATWALSEAGQRGWSDPAVMWTIIAAVVLSALFVLHLRRAVDPLVPPALFGDRTFTVVNLGTFLLYAAIGLAFFLVAYELQVAAGWSALEAGVALLPTTVIMLLLSSRSGALGERLGPRPQLTFGPLLAAGGLLLLAGIGPDTVWSNDVLPGSLLFGLGLVTFVAPLTATVMAAAPSTQTNVASAVNNAVARTGSLAALAIVPVLVALPAASGPREVSDAYRSGLLVAAGLAAVAGVVMAAGLRGRVATVEPDGQLHCAVDGPPLRARADPSPPQS